MRINQESSDPWDACPDGALLQMTQRLHRARRRREVATMVGASGIGVVLVAGILLAAGLLRTPSHLPGGISCSECRQHLMAHQPAAAAEPRVAADLIDALPRQVQQHLAGCPRCREKLEALVAVASRGVGRPEVAWALLTRVCGPASAANDVWLAAAASEAARARSIPLASSLSPASYWVAQ